MPPGTSLRQFSNASPRRIVRGLTEEAHLASKPVISAFSVSLRKEFLR